MRLHDLALTLAFPILATPMLAQEDGAPTGPAKQVTAFHKLLGTWEGSGTVANGAGTTPMKWTATSITKKILGGNFVQEDTHIEFEGEEAPPALAFRTLYGFDRETKKSMAYSISNMGTIEAKQVHWVDGKLMYGGSKTEMDSMTGSPKFVCERWSTTFKGDAYEVIGYQTIGNGRPFQHVRGTFKKSKVANASFSPKKIVAMIPAAKQMSPLHKLGGTYRMKGWMMMMPGMPKTDIGATENIDSIFGGTVIEFRLKGDPIPNFGVYQGWGVMVWSELDNCYKSFWADSMGGAKLVKAHLHDGKIVSGFAATSMGLPVVLSSVLALNDDGSLKAATEHAAFGADAPVQTFSVTYEKK